MRRLLCSPEFLTHLVLLVCGDAFCTVALGALSTAYPWAPGGAL